MSTSIKVAIAPGHYTAHKGVEKNGRVEYNECKALVELLKPFLSRLEPLVETHYLEGPLINKVEEINKLSPHLAIEVHLGNALRDVSGARAFHNPKNNKSVRLGEIICQVISSRTGQTNLGSIIGWYKKISPDMINQSNVPAGWVPKLDLFLDKVQCPAIIVEPYFISNLTDVYRFSAVQEQTKVAEAIVHGIVDFISEVYPQSA